MAYHDVLLINPPSRQRELYEHLGLGYLAACLRQQGIDVKILNMPHWMAPRALQEVKKYSCKLIGVSIPFQRSAVQAFNFISRLKKEGFVTAHVAVGGIYPSFAYEDILKQFSVVDSVVIGEGEKTIVELAEAVIGDGNWRKISGIAFRENDDIVTTELRPSIEDLDAIPFPERDTLPEVLGKLEHAPVLSSRGCYGRCTFCSVVPFFKKFGTPLRMRSSVNVIEELEFLYNRYGVRNVDFNDANFIGGKGRGFRRAQEIAELILKKNLNIKFGIQCRPNEIDMELFTTLKKAGLSKVFVGIESGSQAMLDRFHKDIAVEDNLKALQTLGKLDLITYMGFITFDDRTTIQEFKENMAFIEQAKKLVPQNRLFYDLGTKLLPLAGTDAEKNMKEKGTLSGNSLRFKYKFNDPKMDLLYSTIKLKEDVSRIGRKLKETDKEWIK
ncbi:B12-binding domain-containing radical SAM protein [Phosphitispora sp. TUW77]|uniref:B12-binding domain-containing radical SAM protein n=1 Tax=Phosphitispora sp. TUW77 TaxID=3152361 RepID=UPI003AB1821F